jgi:hypothetical protein
MPNIYIDLLTHRMKLFSIAVRSPRKRKAKLLVSTNFPSQTSPLWAPLWPNLPIQRITKFDDDRYSKLCDAVLANRSNSPISGNWLIRHQIDRNWQNLVHWLLGIGEFDRLANTTSPLKLSNSKSPVFPRVNWVWAEFDKLIPTKYPSHLPQALHRRRAVAQRAPRIDEKQRVLRWERKCSMRLLEILHITWL